MKKEQKELYEFGDFRLDVGERKIERLDGSANGYLPEKAFKTLVHLVRHNGTLVDKDDLLSAVWPDTVVEENNLGKAVHAIRHFLGENKSGPCYIETVPKHGYRFIASVRSLETIGNGHGNGYGLAEQVHANKFPGRSPAFDLYVRGKVKAASENREDTENAIKVLEAAVAIDPFFAPAYAQLARAYNTLAFKFSSDSERKLLHEYAEVAIEKALAMDPELAEGHFARGLILWTNTKGFPHEQAIRSYKRSLAIDPTSDETHHQLSMVYSHIGLIEEALDSLNKALEINPNNTMARYRVGVYKTWQGKFDEVVSVFKTIPSDVSPMLIDRSMAEVLAQTGSLSEAEAIVDNYLNRYPQDEGGSFTSVKALLLAKGGKLKPAKDSIQRALEIGKGFGHFHHTAYNVASAYAAMDKPDEAVKWLKAAADSGFPNYTYFQIDPNLNNLRSCPDFIEFMTKLNLQWHRYKAVAES